MLHTEHPVKVGDKISVDIKRRKRGVIKKYDALCEIVWVKQACPGKYDAGVKFVKVKDEDDFALFMCEEIMEAFL